MRSRSCSGSVASSWLDVAGPWPTAEFVLSVAVLLPITAELGGISPDDELFVTTAAPSRSSDEGSVLVAPLTSHTELPSVTANATLVASKATRHNQRLA